MTNRLNRIQDWAAKWCRLDLTDEAMAELDEIIESERPSSSIDGRSPPKWAKYRATHADGESFWYECKPEPFFEIKCWGYSEGRTIFAEHLPPPDDWLRTLEVVLHRREAP